MKIKIEKIDNPSQLNIESVEVHNDNNFSFKFYTYGGYIHEVNIPINNQEDKTEDVLLGYGNIDGIIESHGYFNSIVGRVANRIGFSKFKIDNNEYQLYPNTPPNHLHGGKVGFNKKIWKIEKIDETKNSIKCIMKYFSHDMEENYPGNLDCTVIYELNNNNELLRQVHHGNGVRENDVSWEMDTLKSRLREKHTESFFVYAETRGKSGDQDESFHYKSVKHTGKLDASVLPTLIETGVVTVDYTIKEKSPGVAKDQGYLFKIAPSDLDLLFFNVSKKSSSIGNVFLSLCFAALK